MFLKKCIAAGMAALLLVSGFASAAALPSSGVEAGSGIAAYADSGEVQYTYISVTDCSLKKWNGGSYNSGKAYCDHTYSFAAEMTASFGVEPPGNGFNIVQATVPAGASRLTGYVGMCDNAINNTGNYDSSNYVEIYGAATDWSTDKGTGTDGLTLLGTTKKFVAGDLSNGYDSFDVDVADYAYVQFRTYNGNYAHTDHITYFDTQFAVALDTTDADAAAAVDTLIQALPEASAVTFADAAQIEAARAAYEKLTVTQKGLVTSLARLEAAEAAFAYCYPEGTLIWAEDTALSATAGNLRVALEDGDKHKFSYTQNETNEFEHGFRFDSSFTEYDTITIAVPKGAFFFSTFFGRDYGASTLNGGGGDNKVGHADFYIGETMVATALHEDGKGNYAYFSIPEGTETISIRVYMGNNNWWDHMIFANALFVSSVDDTPADYDAVDAAVAKAGEIDRTAYTVASCKAVDAAVAAVVRGKFAVEQADVDAMAAAITAAIANLKEKSGYTFSDSWTMEKEDKSLYDLESETQVTIYTTTGDLWGYPTVYNNMLLTDAAEGDFSISTKLSFAPNAEYQSAGLIVLNADKTDLFSIQRRYHTGYSGNCICGVYMDSKNPGENAVADTALGSDIYLKIERAGSTLTAYWSTDNSDWQTVWTKENASLSGAVQVGLFTGKGGSMANTAEIPATFRDFTLNDTVLSFTAPAPASADYTAVDAALEKADALNEADYTVASWAKLQAAIEAVVRDLSADEQATVDGYAAAIEAAISALTPKSVEMELTISTGMVTAAAAEGKYDITWNARILLGEELKVDDINAAGVQFKNYGVYYGTGKDVLNDYKNATADQIRQVVFDKGEDVDVYTAYGFRLKNVAEKRVRAAMFYVEYELNGQSYILLSTVDEVVAVIAE